MAKFAYINVAEFRDALERDYIEMQACLEAKSWKGCQVLAGSIVEALIVDHIVTASVPIPAKKDPLKLDLSDAINICRDNKIITDRTADLCSVIRSYRNLIHPGRLIRMGERAPSPQSASIAASLVELIAEELSAARQSLFGLTAEQIVTKLEMDHNSLTLLPHLLKETHESEVEKLLCATIPDKYFELRARPDDMWDTLAEACLRIKRAFRMVISSAPEPIRIKAANRFVHILKNDQGYHVDSYSEAFLIPEDVLLLPKKDQPIVRSYLFSKLPQIHDSTTATKAVELAKIVDNDTIRNWLDPFIRSLVLGELSETEASAIRSSFLEAQQLLSKEAEKVHDSRLNSWHQHFRNQGDEVRAKAIQALRTSSASARLPF